MKNAAAFEYRIENEAQEDLGLSDLPERLGKLSADGWEAVSAISSQDGRFRVLLRREVKP